MKTKIRIILQDKVNYRGMGEFRTLVFQILRKTYPDQPKSTGITPVGLIKWQTDPKTAPRWYGIKYEVASEKAIDFEIMAKIIKLIKNKAESYDPSPKEVFKLLDGDEWTTDNVAREWLPVSKSGQMIYKVLRKTEYYSVELATSEGVAQKRAEKKHGAVPHLKLLEWDEFKATPFNFDIPVTF